MKLKLLRQICRMSKFALYGLFLQFLMVGLLLAENGAGQGKSVDDIYLSVHFENEQLLQAFANIETKTSFKFTYFQSDFELQEAITLVEENASLGDILRKISKETNLKFKRVNQRIYISRKNAFSKPVQEVFDSGLLPIKVSGTVTSASNGEPLPGVSIVIKGTYSGTITDLNGNYSLETDEGAILQFSYIGFITQEITVGNQTIIDIIMNADVTALEEIVVVGYGTQKKSDLTSSISQVSGSAIERSPVSNVAMALQGRASGVELLNDGTPGKAPNIRIRGIGTVNSTEPLIVLDGVFVDADILSKLSTYEIQSVEILKDAASGAIYGTRAANGVILITTKSGKYNQKIVTRANVAMGINQLIKKYPVANGEEIYMLKRERYIMDGIPIEYPWTDEYFNKTRTDWQDEMFQTALFQDYNLQISGGTDKSTLHASINYRNEEGTALNTWYKRLSLNLKSTQKITNRFTVEENIRLSWSKDRLYNEGTGTSVTMYPAYKYPPSLPVKWDDGNVRPGQIVGGWGSGKESDEFGDMWNPVYKALEEWNYTTDLNALINLKGEYEITKDLSIVGTGSYTHTVGSYERFQGVTPLQSRSENSPNLEEGNSVNSFALGELYAKYHRSFGGHNVAATAGTSAQLSTGNFMNMRGEGFASILESQLVLDNADVISGGGGEFPSTSLLSYFIRGTYNYENKYYFSGIMRADGSSRFAEGNQWGYFPAVSAGWRISSEKFISSSSLISNMKLNVGYGQLGNQNVGPFQYLNIYRKDRKYLIAGNNVTGTSLSSFANPDITWETTTTLNILLETAFLADKIILDVAYFDRLTTDMLLPATKHFTAGTVSLPDANTGEMKNKGVEIEVSFNNQHDDFGYSVGMNATFLKNKLLKLNDEVPYLESGVSRTYVGEPIASFYGWKTDGIYQNQGQIDSDPNISADPRKSVITPGDVIFVDTNGDNIVDEQDRVHIGDGNPTALLGFYVDLSYKGFNLSLVFSGTVGQKLYDEMMMRGINSPETDGTDKIMLERWTGEGSTNKWPRMSTTEKNQNYRYSELGIKNGSYLRMKDATFSYSLPSNLLDKLELGQTRIFVSGRNLLTFTEYDGTDVEETGRGNNLTRGVIYNNYPTSRTITFGLDLSF